MHRDIDTSAKQRSLCTISNTSLILNYLKATCRPCCRFEIFDPVFVAYYLSSDGNQNSPNHIAFMRARKLHRCLGIILLLPFFGWAITGLVFFMKPGYAAAYETLSLRTYPLTASSPITADPSWLEFRSLRTVLGEHLLVRTESGWKQLNLATRQPRPMPNQSEVKLLLQDAFAANPSRYGSISRVSGNKVWTDTGVEVNIDWNRMNLQQRGKDTDRIDLLYRIHYLQWTGVKTLDKIVGFAGIVLVMALTTLGAWLAFKRS